MSASGPGAIFTSAYRPKHRDASAPRRRRGSEAAEPSSSSSSGRALGHARSMTEDAGGGGRTHPLRAARSHSRAGIAAAEATRPRLQRVLSSDADGDVDDGDEARGRPATREDGAETTVLVHAVAPGDSLAGVALRHGVSVAAVRRANKLWASDSIHLRAVLYIPLAQARLPTSPPPADADAEDPWALAPALASPAPTPTSPAPAAEIRRVPASQLSFFPPPSRANASRAQTLPRPRPTPIPGIDLAALFRPSLDSSGSSDAEHEMGDVSHHRARRRPAPPASATYTAPAAPAPAPVRTTVQMRPSPAMQLPLSPGGKRDTDAERRPRPLIG
jgi:LysM repeat protein